eukprot:TRINITY_DN35005_c0_g1_i1.p1 TRINITY_DN35005_c0_g1~~TRINITY_DN35005_c0_g1_i1.p1  ORF type:complete len:693 (+),score=206.60 TRINITY_DN35005_c0_g1_i1:81-2081(+)
MQPSPAPSGADADAALVGWRAAAYASARASLLRAAALRQGGTPQSPAAVSSRDSGWYANARQVLLRRASAARAAAGAAAAQWPSPPSDAGLLLEQLQRRAVATDGASSGGSQRGRRSAAAERPRSDAGGQRPTGPGSAAEAEGALIPPAAPGRDAPGQPPQLRPSYLCESALRDFLRYGAGTAVQSTARCSTITQDMDLDSLSDETPSQQEEAFDDWEDMEQVAEAREGLHLGAVDRGLAHPARPAASAASETDTDEVARAGHGAALQRQDTGEADFRVTHRFGEPEGLGPAAGHVTALRHCAGSAQLLAAGTDLGHIYLLRAWEGVPPAERLAGHSAQVMDLEWSDNGHYLLSVALDNVTRIWSGWGAPGDAARAGCARCVRQIPDLAFCLAVRFTPRNNNIFAVAAAAAASLAPSIKLYNLSTGKVVRKHKVKRAVSYFAWSDSGDCLFTADVGGCVTAYAYDFMTQNAKKGAVAALTRGSAVTSLACLAVPSGPDGEPRALLLANTMASAVFLMRVTQGPQLRIAVLRRVALPQRQAILRSAFCPLPGISTGAFATGSEDGSVWLVHPGRRRGEQGAPLLKLQGHQGAVLNVSVDGQGGIASGDELGCVMLWRRAGAEEQLEHDEDPEDSACRGPAPWQAEPVPVAPARRIASVSTDSSTTRT